MVSGESKCKGTEVERSLESLSHPTDARTEKKLTKMVDKEQCGGGGKTLYYQDVGDGSNFPVANPNTRLRSVTRLLCLIQRLLKTVLGGFPVCKLRDVKQHICPVPSSVIALDACLKPPFLLGSRKVNLVDSKVAKTFCV